MDRPDRSETEPLPLPPVELAAPLLAYLLQHLVRDARDGGAVVLPGLAAYLRQLAEAAGTVRRRP